MKTILQTVLMAALLLAATSCNKDKDKYVFPEPTYAAQAGLLTAVEPNEVLTEVELTESGLYFLTRNDTDGTAVIKTTGKYTCHDNMYMLEYYGRITLGTGAKSKESASATVLLENGDEHVIPCTLSRGDRNDLFRSWSIKKTEVTLTGAPNVAKDFTGCDLTEITMFLSDHGIKGNKANTRTVQSLSVTATGSIIVRYTDKTWETATWHTLSANEIRYTWGHLENPFPLTNNRAEISYADDTCTLTLELENTGVNKYKRGTISFTMKTIP